MWYERCVPATFHRGYRQTHGQSLPTKSVTPPALYARDQIYAFLIVLSSWTFVFEHGENKLS